MDYSMLNDYDVGYEHTPMVSFQTDRRSIEDIGRDWTLQEVIHS